MNGIKRLAFLNFGGIGDEILFSPVIQTVRSALPDTHLTLILENRSRSIEALLPQVNEVIGLDIQRKSRVALFGELLRALRRGRYDAVISSGSSPFIAVLLALSGAHTTVGFDSGPLARMLLTTAAPLRKSVYAGAMYFSLAQSFMEIWDPQWETPPEADYPELRLTPQALAQGELLLGESIPGQKRILIHPGVSRISVEKNILKAWPVSHWQELICQLAEQDPESRVVLLGGPDDQEVLTQLEAYRQSLPPVLQGQIVNLNGKTRNLLDLAAVIAHGDVLISVDSAPMHLAIGLKTPVVAIFSPTDPKKLVPPAPWIQVACREDLACRPCLWDHRSQSCEQPVCLDVPVSEVLNRVNGLLNRPSLVS